MSDSESDWLFLPAQDTVDTPVGNNGLPQAPLWKQVLQLVKRKYVGSYLCARSQSSFWKAHAPTGQSLPLRNMTYIEPRSLFELARAQDWAVWSKQLPPRDADGLENHVLSPNNGARTLG